MLVHQRVLKTSQNDNPKRQSNGESRPGIRNLFHTIILSLPGLKDWKQVETWWKPLASSNFSFDPTHWYKADTLWSEYNWMNSEKIQGTWDRLKQTVWKWTMEAKRMWCCLQSFFSLCLACLGQMLRAVPLYRYLDILDIHTSLSEEFNHWLSLTSCWVGELRLHFWSGILHRSCRLTEQHGP